MTESFIQAAVLASNGGGVANQQQARVSFPAAAANGVARGSGDGSSSIYEPVLPPKGVPGKSSSIYKVFRC